MIDSYDLLGLMRKQNNNKAMVGREDGRQQLECITKALAAKIWISMSTKSPIGLLQHHVHFAVFVWSLL